MLDQSLSAQRQSPQLAVDKSKLERKQTLDGNGDQVPATQVTTGNLHAGHEYAQLFSGQTHGRFMGGSFDDEFGFG